MQTALTAVNEGIKQSIELDTVQMLMNMCRAMKPEALARLSAMIPAGCIGEPDEIAHTVQFIIENDFVNGRSFEVDGGMRL